MGVPGGHWPPLGQNLSKASKFLAILYYLGNIASKFWQFYIFWASLRQNFGQFNIHQIVSILVKTFFLKVTLNWTEKPSQFQGRPFFLEVTLIWTEKPIAYQAKFNVIFQAKVNGAPPNPFELLRLCRTFCLKNLLSALVACNMQIM